MRATLSARRISYPASGKVLDGQPGRIRQLLKPLLSLAENSDFLIEGSIGEFAVGKVAFQIPRFIFMGPGGGGDNIRMGIFAAIHGDQPEGVEVLVNLLQELEMTPQTARNYHIYAYPICNPSGLVKQTRQNASGKDLSKEFWHNSLEPEIYYLEREMGVLHFQGVISLHVEDLPNGFTVNSNSAVLNRALAQPAIQAAKRFLPGSFAKTEVNPDSPANLASEFLTKEGELKPMPFELHIGIPKQLPRPSQVHGAVSALKTILDAYRTLLSISQNI